MLRDFNLRAVGTLYLWQRNLDTPLSGSALIGSTSLVSREPKVPRPSFELNGCDAISSTSPCQALRSVSPQIDFVCAFGCRRFVFFSTTNVCCGLFISFDPEQT